MAVSALGLFWLVVIAASLCAVVSVAVMVRGWRTGQADLALTGGFFYALSVLPLAHGITTPGVLYGQNAATAVAVLLAIPFGLLTAGPMLSRTWRHGVVGGARWRRWLVGTAGLSTLAAVALLVAPDLLPAPSPRSAPVLVIAAVSFTGCVLLSANHLRLALIARRPGPLLVGAGYGLVAATAFIWLGSAPYSTGFWVAHGLDITGVFLGTIAGLVVYRRTEKVGEVLASVLAVEPLGALEVGLDPVVHRFVAELEEKDQITRDHVIRTAELAVHVAWEMGLAPDVVRKVGLAAILHDVGKLEIPDAVLNKPGRLDDDEYAVIKTHAEIGARLVSASPVLAEIVEGVRGHHERIDGGGYPDGLAGEAIPIVARIVSVCDAYDAMAHTRQYRAGMGSDRAIAILREHAGSQWDEAAVEAVAVTVARNPVPSRGLADVGRVGCDCLPQAADDDGVLVG
ncbi:MAG: HD-GYP domain-containing protein [Actinomycetota bacterium]